MWRLGLVPSRRRPLLFGRSATALVFSSQSKCSLPPQHSPSPKLFTPHRLGIEGLVSFKNDQQFDAENYSLSILKPDSTTPVTVSVFDKVTVRVEVEKDKNTQRGRVKMTLVSPVDTKEM